MITAVFKPGETKTYTRTCFQYDKGQELTFVGIEYPPKCEVHFSNEEDGGLSYAIKMEGSSVRIPDPFFNTGKYIYAWLYARDVQESTKGGINYHFEEIDQETRLIIDSATPSTKGRDDSETLFTVVIPVKRRPDIFRVADIGDSDDPDEPENMEYDVNGEDMSIDSMGNDGTGKPQIQSYEIHGENLVLGQ